MQLKERWRNPDGVCLEIIYCAITKQHSETSKSDYKCAIYMFDRGIFDIDCE